MKMKHYLPIALATLTLSANAEFREHKCVATLKMFEEGPYNYSEKKNGYNDSVKIEKSKVGNKEILELLMGEGVIDSINGWSIKFVTNGPGNLIEVMLTKKNQTPIFVSGYFFWHLDDEVSGFSTKYRENKDGEARENVMLEERGWGYFGFDIDGVYMETSCESRWTGETDYDDSKPDYDGKDRTNTCDFQSCAGYIDNGVIKGDVKGGKGKKTTIILP